ncbi:hypothetical protein E4T56_gene18217 [Termitomyces sp. T112]|nr:hypothetical protein E4T56_gene18217 [Termitomyces sp. T112]
MIQSVTNHLAERNLKRTSLRIPAAQHSTSAGSGGMGTTVQKTGAAPNPRAIIAEVIQRTLQFSRDLWGSRKSSRDVKQAAEVLELSRPVPWIPAHCPATSRFPKTPDTPPNFCPCPAPILVSPNATSANSNTSPANSNGPLANFDAFPAATDTYPGSPKPREPPPLFLIFAIHHQLNTLVPLTHSGVLQQPQGNLHSQMIPSTYQRGLTLNRNQHPPTPSSSAKPCHRSQCTPKFSGKGAEVPFDGSGGDRVKVVLGSGLGTTLSQNIPRAYGLLLYPGPYFNTSFGALLLEDKGFSLAEYFSESPIRFTLSLDQSIKFRSLLNWLHDEGIVHGSLTRKSLVLNRNQLYPMDVSIKKQ